ncbi:MAG: ROK family protein, partial [Pyrinomonadaceae bacterium]
MISATGEQVVSRDTALPNLERATIVEQITDLVSDMARSAKGRAITDLGIAVPGMVDMSSQRVALSFDIPSLTGMTSSIVADNSDTTDFYQELKLSTGRDVILINDANAAGYAEFILGAGRGCRNLFYATLGAGVGGA